MEILAFLAHFLYIFLTFAAGTVVGFMFKERIEAKLDRLFNRKD